MACRGYFLALDESCTAQLLAQDGDDERLIEVIQELGMTDAPDHCEVDKAWDGIHRCLTEGRLGGEDGSYPLNAVVLGGLPTQTDPTATARLPESDVTASFQRWRWR